MQNDELSHEGVKGMRWGYTNGQRNGGRVAGEGEDGVRREYNEENYDGFFDETTKETQYTHVDGSTYVTEITTVKKGKLSRAIESGLDFVESVAEETVSSIQSFLKKGKKFLDKLF